MRAMNFSRELSAFCVLTHVFLSFRRMGVVGRYHYEIAELYYSSLRDEGLTVQMVEVDDEQITKQNIFLSFRGKKQEHGEIQATAAPCQQSRQGRTINFARDPALNRIGKMAHLRSTKQKKMNAIRNFEFAFASSTDVYYLKNQSILQLIFRTFSSWRCDR